MSTSTEQLSRLVLTQPMFMPWHGLFSQILLADRVLIYDDVQLPKGGGAGRGFITRVQIKTERGTEWLSVPVGRSGHGEQRICDARMADTPWREQHLARIRQAYGHTEYFQDIFEQVILPIYRLETDLLVDFLVRSMETIARAIGITTPWERTSQGNWAPNLAGAPRVVEIARLTGARFYLSGYGGMKYLDYRVFEQVDVRVQYLSYRLLPYQQSYGEFTPYVSLIDLLFHVGREKAAAHLQSEPIDWMNWPTQLDGRPVPSKSE